MSYQIILNERTRLVFKKHDGKDWVFSDIENANFISLEKKDQEDLWMVQKDFILEDENIQQADRRNLPYRD